MQKGVYVGNVTITGAFPIGTPIEEIAVRFREDLVRHIFDNPNWVIDTGLRFNEEVPAAGNQQE